MKLGEKSVSAIVLSDLQEGALVAVVEFPPFRDGLTKISTEFWKNMSLDNFTDRSSWARQGEEADYEVPVDSVSEREWELLRQTTWAVFCKKQSDIPSEYAQHFRQREWLKKSMEEKDWEELVDYCFASHRELTELEINSQAVLCPKVRADQMELYFSKVRSDQGTSTKINKGGVPSAFTGRTSMKRWCRPCFRKTNFLRRVR